MAAITWLRALSAVGAVAEATRALRARSAEPVAHAPLREDGGLETRLAGVVVAALREAFDRDRARFDLERDVHESEQARKERVLRLEWRRQTGMHALTQTRHLILLTLAVWGVSVGAAAALGPLTETARVLLGLGWLGLVIAAGAALATHRGLTAWLAHSVAEIDDELPRLPVQTAMPWAFLGGFVLTAAALVVQL